MENTEEHTRGLSHNEGGGTSSIKLNWAFVPSDWDAKEHTLIEKLGLVKYVETCRDTLPWRQSTITMKPQENFKYKE